MFEILITLFWGSKHVDTLFGGIIIGKMLKNRMIKFKIINLQGFLAIKVSLLNIYSFIERIMVSNHSSY